jgi:ketosteroid isomerase-like protein
MNNIGCSFNIGEHSALGGQLVMKRELAFITALAAMIALLCLSIPRRAFSQTADGQAVKQAYAAYVQAWKLKDIAALQKLISDEYMAMNFESKLSDKENEIATAKTDAEWISMSVDEIHTRVFGNTAIASGLLSAQGKRPDGTTFNAKVRFLAALVKHDGVWQLVATQSTPIKAARAGQK